jgi:hypothetical protein
MDVPPFIFSIGHGGGTPNIDDCCTKRGLLPLPLVDGSLYYQPCYYCKNATETIISPESVVDASDTFISWHQSGHKGGLPGSICFEISSGLLSMTLHLQSISGLYYCPLDILTVDDNPICPYLLVLKVALNTPIPHLRAPSKFTPVSKDHQLESEVWSLRLSCPGEHQLDILPGNVLGLPSVLEYCFIDFHAQARVCQQAAQRTAVHVDERCKEFHMVFGFMRASANNYTQPSKTTDRIIQSYDGYSSYLLIVNAVTRFRWVFLTTSKEPPLDIVNAFMQRFALWDGGFVHTDHGDELACSSSFCNTMLRTFNYVVEPTGADSPLQNRAIKFYNGYLAVKVWTSLYM